MSGAAQRRRSPFAAILLVLPLFTACANNSATHTTLTFAEYYGTPPPNYILPLAPLRYFSVANLSQFQYLMYRPLYWFGSAGAVTLNQGLSLAQTPQYSADGRDVTITLKPYRWSDGYPVTTRDVQFWQNLLVANKQEWGAYTPGEYPDNVTGVTVLSPTVMTFHLNQAYGSYWFTYNELSQITPLPQHVWDRETPGGPVGNYDATPSGAIAVYQFLAAQAAQLSTYDTNPLWQVVDGPWKLRSIDAAGDVRMVPNPQYAGPVKPSVREFDEVPFTSDAAELDAVRSGGVDYGYIPLDDVAQRQSVSAAGETLVPWQGWQVAYLPLNFTNPRTGPMFQQLYFRQAMQMLIDQPDDIADAYGGFASQTYGPVPLKTRSPFGDSGEVSASYTFSTAGAQTLLRAHGWRVTPGGVDTCAVAGSAASACGPGIAAGTRASFSLRYAGGLPEFDSMMQRLRADFAQAGIQVSLSTEPFQQVIAAAAPCAAGKPCSWDMEFWGVWVYSPDYFPSGDLLWQTDGSSNAGGYSDPTLDRLVQSTETSDSLQALNAYEDYAAKQLPSLWMPTPVLQLSAISQHLQGAVPQDPLANIYPENWYWE